MLHTEGIKSIRRVPWRSLPTGGIVLAGVEIDGKVIPELYGYPMIDDRLARELTRKYQFLSKRSVVVVEPTDPVAAVTLSRDIRTMSEQVSALRTTMGDLQTERASILEKFLQPSERRRIEEHPEELLSHPKITETDRLIKDTYNSFTVSVARGTQVPSFLRGGGDGGGVGARNRDASGDGGTARGRGMTPGDGGTGPRPAGPTLVELLMHEMNNEKYLPRDIPVQLHLALDASFSMVECDCTKLENAVAAFNRLSHTFGTLLKNTEIFAYVFSDETKRIEPDFGSWKLTPGETNMATLFKRVLHFRDRDRYNKLIVITDGEPSDYNESIRLAALLKKNRVDFTQILLHSADDHKSEVLPEFAHLKATDGYVKLPDDGREIGRERSQEEQQRLIRARFDNFTRIAETAGGNQVVLTAYDALGLLTMDVYDRYIGLLTLVE